ncbi:Nif3-like dinuclear metal center hexameric protein [Aliiglaciecola sp. CAU 1673]|uniref:Nif3-like dinuclear metal center hexameric protein n=1 Tax=Aliiglaciecola sp. CAU 1673 TaxID=3032595 RepID=UPI0023DB6009|nr:Nif3-like dinuclear metal center hexameric protein [Aliiglaciecola sp. CAU 1673]MDF2177588.1 Nif3-like dinuclear metal center hexameric protein [Aliiglaciecola sp. CAU 1673]
MSLSRESLLSFLNETLKPERIKDYCPNGLQVEGKSQINRIITGVTASQALIDAAIAQQADAIFVHHGFFWRGEDPRVVGMRKRRLQALLAHDISLFAYHLPLDIHPQLGNNAQLAKLLDIETEGGLETDNPQSVAMRGRFKTALTAAQLALRIEEKLERKPLVEGHGGTIHTVAWCTGGGQSFIEQAAEQGVDAFISGEVSEQTIHVARECGIQFFAAGHHATERYGAKAVGELLAQKFDVDVRFIDIDNPA